MPNTLWGMFAVRDENQTTNLSPFRVTHVCSFRCFHIVHPSLFNVILTDAVFSFFLLSSSSDSFLSFVFCFSFCFCLLWRDVYYRKMAEIRDDGPKALCPTNQLLWFHQWKGSSVIYTTSLLCNFNNKLRKCNAFFVLLAVMTTLLCICKNSNDTGRVKARVIYIHNTLFHETLFDFGKKQPQ